MIPCLHPTHYFLSHHEQPFHQHSKLKSVSASSYHVSRILLYFLISILVIIGMYCVLLLVDSIHVKFDEYKCKAVGDSETSLIRHDLNHYMYPIVVNVTNIANNVKWTHFCKYQYQNETVKCVQTLLVQSGGEFTCFANSKKIQKLSSFEITESSDISLRLLEEFTYTELYWNLLACACVIFGVSISLFLLNKYSNNQQVREFIRFGKAMTCITSNSVTTDDGKNQEIISEHKQTEQLIINTDHPALNILSSIFLPEEELLTYEAIPRNTFRHLLISTTIAIIMLLTCLALGIVLFIYSFSSIDDHTIVSWMAPLLILPALFAIFHTTRFIQVSEHYFITNKRVYCLRSDHIANHLCYVMRDSISEIFNDADHEGNVYGKIKVFDETISCILFNKVSNPYYYIKLLTQEI